MFAPAMLLLFVDLLFQSCTWTEVCIGADVLSWKLVGIRNTEQATLTIYSKV